MKVLIKSFHVDMQIKQKGIELEVRSPDGSMQLGDCYATMTGLTWCAGRTTQAKGIKLTWEEFATICSSPEARAAALKAAKNVS